MMPNLLVQAQTQGIGRPEKCIQLSQEFLQRPLLDNHYTILEQNPNGYQESSERYRTQKQSIEAMLVQSACLTRLDQHETAAKVLGRTLQEASAQKNDYLAAIAHYQMASNALESGNKLPEVRAHLVKMQELINLHPEQVNQLPHYASLLRIAYAITAKQFELATQSLASLTGEEPISGEEVSRAVLTSALELKGDLHHAKGQDELALAYYSDALKMASEEHNLLVQALLTDKMSQLFSRQGDLKRAIDYLELSCDQFQQVGNPSWLAQGLVKLAILNRQKGDNNLALSLLFNALDLHHTLNRPLELAYLNLEVGKTYLRMDSIDAAKPYLSSARGSFRLYRSDEGLLETTLTEAELHLQEHDPALAIKLLESSLPPESERSADPRIYLLLSRAYEEKGQFQNALNNYQRFFALHQHSEHDLQQEENHEFADNYQQLALERHNKELQLAQEKLHARSQQYLLLAMATGLLVILLVIGIYWQYRQKKKWWHLGQKLISAEAKMPITALANQYQLDMDLAKWQQQSDEGNYTPTLHFYHLHIPLLDRLCIDMGSTLASQQFQRIATELRHYCQENINCYQLSCSRFLLVQHTLTQQLPRQVADALIELLSSTLSPYGNTDDLAIGMAGFPFINRSPGAITIAGIVELSLLALAAARQIGDKSGKPSWVELSAIDCQQAAFFNGELRVQTLKAIALGLVKVNAKDGKSLIDWPQLANE